MSAYAKSAATGRLPMVGDRPASIRFRFVLLLIYAAFVAARMPEILLKGRFWAEEGAIYYLNGRDLPWYDALVSAHTGYMNLAASLATLLAARIVPVELAPRVSTGFALLIQLCPAWLLLTSGVAWLGRRWVMAVALLVLLAATPSGEVWLNSITSQFHLALCCALILALPVRGGRTGLFRNALIGLASLSGPISSFLAPLFIARGIRDRAWSRLAQGVVLGCGGAFQLLLILLNPEPARAIGLGPRLFALIVYVKQILLPFAGTARTEHLTAGLTQDVLAGHLLLGPLLLSCAGMAAMLFAVWRSRNAELPWLLAAGIVLLTGSYFGALGAHLQLLSVTFGDRYAYAPNAVFGLVLLGIALTAGWWWLRGLASILVCVLVWTGMHAYADPGAGFADGSTWRVEIARWQRDPSYHVQLWPNNDIWRWPFTPLPGVVRR